MKKIVLKYVIEFSVIVLGISVSFWFDKYQTSLDNIDREKEVLSELSTELEVIENTVKNRDSVFRFDTENLILPEAYVNPSLKEFCLSDYLIILKWIDYAKGIGDPTSELFSSIPIKYDEIWKIAKARVKE